MKKIFKMLVLFILCWITVGCVSFGDIKKPKTKDVEITIYYRDDCKFCNQLSNHLDSQEESIKKQLKIKKYNINEQQNRELFNQRIEELGLSRVGVPFIVIGDNYLIGFQKEQFNTFIYENVNINLS